MERRLPAEYTGWQDHESAFRRMTTPELVHEIQDGSPERRLAALSVIDLSEVAPPTIEDWIRTLPDAEANELAGAIPAQRPHASCEEDVRWVDVARLGYEQRRLPTFLVMLFSSPSCSSCLPETIDFVFRLTPALWQVGEDIPFAASVGPRPF